MAFPDGWGRKVKITIPDAQISGSNTDFPVLLTDSEFPVEMLDGGANSALNGGGDVRFSEDAAGTIRLDLDIVTFVTGGTPDVELHTKMPTLNTGAAKEFYAWYKKAAETQPAVTAAFGRNAVWSDYNGVAHFKDDPTGSAGDLIDSSGNGDGDSSGSLVAASAGQIGNAWILDGTNDQVDFTTALPNTAGSFHYSVWANWDVVGTGPQDFLAPIFLKNGSTEWLSVGSFTTAGSPFKIVTNAESPGDSGVSVNTGTWYKIDLVWDGADLEMWADAGNIANYSVTPTGIGWKTVTEFLLGSDTDNWSYFDGLIDEVRSENRTASQGWITTEFNNQSAPATFASAGTPEDVGGVTTIRYSLSLTGVG